MKTLKVTLLTAILLMCSSCTLMGIGYSYADWLIKKRILSVVKLYKPQQKHLEKQLDDYMAWHKVTMLPEYGKELDRVAKRVEALKKDKKKVVVTSPNISISSLEASPLTILSSILHIHPDPSLQGVH